MILVIATNLPMAYGNEHTLERLSWESETGRAWQQGSPALSHAVRPSPHGQVEDDPFLVCNNVHALTLLVHA